jgi:hypothetical protein
LANVPVGLRPRGPALSGIVEAGPQRGSDVLSFGESGPRFAVIEASVAGKTLRLQVDSGFEGLLLYSDRLPALYRDRMASSAVGQSHIANVAQSFTAQTLDAPVVQIGDWRALRAEISVLDGPVQSHDFDGLIGTAFLTKTRVAFDFQNGMIYWE